MGLIWIGEIVFHSVVAAQIGNSRCTVDDSSLYRYSKAMSTVMDVFIYGAVIVLLCSTCCQGICRSNTVVFASSSSSSEAPAPAAGRKGADKKKDKKGDQKKKDKKKDKKKAKEVSCQRHRLLGR